MYEDVNTIKRNQQKRGGTSEPSMKVNVSERSTQELLSNTKKHPDVCAAAGEDIG